MHWWLSLRFQRLYPHPALPLIWVVVVGGVILAPPSFGFLLITVKAVTLAFWSIQLHLIRDICANFGAPNSPQSPDIGLNSVESISYFRISRQSLMKENCPNSISSDDIDMKLGVVPTLDSEIKRRQNNLTMTIFCQIVTSFSFPDLWPIWSNPEAGFRTRSL